MRSAAANLRALSLFLFLPVLNQTRIAAAKAPRNCHHALAASQRLSQVAALFLFLPLLNQTRISAAKAPRNCHHALAASQRLSQGPVTAFQF